MKTHIIISMSCIYLVVLSACTKYTIEGPGQPEEGYVGSELCKSCHEEIYNATKETGMYNALTVVENGSPVIPSGSDDLTPPDEYDWSDLSFVIGGFEWSANFVAESGKVVTQKMGSQFNVADLSRVHYKPETEDGTLEFVCGECHTTGWGKVTEEYSPHYISSFPEKYSEEGVRCEACHGPGAIHTSNGSASSIVRDGSSELCGQCHSNSDDNIITAEGSFIAIGQQYEEWYSSDHREEGITCVGCHDPHASAIRKSSSGPGVKECSSCHEDKNSDKHSAWEVTCTECHMPKSLKVALEKNAYTGDASAHIFKINTDTSYSMFSDDGQVNKDGEGLSLDYVCYQCHKDENGAGGIFSIRSMEELSQKASGFHD